MPRAQEGVQLGELRKLTSVALKWDIKMLKGQLVTTTDFWCPWIMTKTIAKNAGVFAMLRLESYGDVTRKSENRHITV